MRRALGLTCMIVGVVGIVACVLLIPAIWIGRSAALQEVAELSGTVSMPLAQAKAASEQFKQRITSIRGSIDQVASDAGAATSGGIEGAFADRLLQALDETVAPAYLRLRDAYVTLRERVVGAAQAAAAIQ